MVEGYVRRAQRFLEISDPMQLAILDPEIARGLNCVDLPPAAAARRMLELHRRHGEDVFSVLVEGRRKYAEEWQRGTLPDSCLLVLATPLPYRSTVHEETPPTFRREGDGWLVRFGEEEKYLKDRKGFRHLRQLLANPGHAFHCMELQGHEAGETTVPMEVGDAVLDKTARKQYRERVHRIEHELKKVALPAAKRRALARERASIVAALKSATGRGGRARQLGSGEEKVRKAVWAAIDDALKVTAVRAPLFAEHVRASLHLGFECTYRPNPPLEWMVE